MRALPPTPPIAIERHDADQEPKQLDCFVTERHNKMAKGIAEPVENCNNFERTVLGAAVLHQLRTLKAMGPSGNALAPPMVDSTELRSAIGAVEVFVATSLRWEGGLFKVGEIVRSRGGECFVVDACASISGDLHIVARGIEIHKRGDGVSTGSVINENLVIKLADADLTASAWAWRSRNGEYVIAHARC